MKNRIKTIIRFIIAIILIVLGAYWFIDSFSIWHNNNYSISLSKMKNKDTFIGVLYSTAFIAYGLWEIRNIVNNKKT